MSNDKEGVFSAALRRLNLFSEAHAPPRPLPGAVTQHSKVARGAAYPPLAAPIRFTASGAPIIETLPSSSLPPQRRPSQHGLSNGKERSGEVATSDVSSALIVAEIADGTSVSALAAADKAEHTANASSVDGTTGSIIVAAIPADASPSVGGSVDAPVAASSSTGLDSSVTTSEPITSIATTATTAGVTATSIPKTVVFSTSSISTSTSTSTTSSRSTIPAPPPLIDPADVVLSATIRGSIRHPGRHTWEDTWDLLGTITTILPPTLPLPVTSSAASSSSTSSAAISTAGTSTLPTSSSSSSLSALRGTEECASSTDGSGHGDKDVRSAASSRSVSNSSHSHTGTAGTISAAATTSSSGSGGGSGGATPSSTSSLRLSRFQKCLEAKAVDISKLKALAWSGVPSRYRQCTWQMLLGYLPTSRERQASSLAKKKQDYQQCVATYFGARAGITRTDAEQTLLRQVLVDVPRTTPDIPLIHSDFVQRSLERVLYVWAMRHPASGYVQGINDLATPFYSVFLSPWVELDTTDLSHVNPLILLDIEADVYGCLTKLLDTIQDHYTPLQPGIHRMMARLRDLMLRVDEDLVLHLERNSAEIHHFAFRWMNNLLMRELPFRLIFRVWDACFAEAQGFDEFYVYVCGALLHRFARNLKAMQFPETFQFIQKLPAATQHWTETDINELLSQAYIYKSLYASEGA